MEMEIGEFRIDKTNIAHVKLSDATSLDLRIVILNITEGIQKPVGPDLKVGHQVAIIVHSPPSVKDDVKDKPTPPDDSYLQNPTIWEDVSITSAEDAFEECLYKAKDENKYRVRVEVSLQIVVKTSEYRDVDGNPIYHARWSVKISTRKEA